LFCLLWRRDDPSVDENTRLRNRIAELESLVRELRGAYSLLVLDELYIYKLFYFYHLPPGKPHPRWADSNFRDGDPNEKWHSRATKCAPLTKSQPQRRASSPHSLSLSPTDHHGPRPPALLPPIKTEVPPESTSPHLYRFSNSPGPGARAYPPFSEGARAGSFEGGYDYPINGSDDGHRHGYGGGGHYSPSSAGGSGSNGSRGGNAHNGTNGHAYCPCRASPGMAHAYISLSQGLQSTLNAARTYAAHPPGTPCQLYRRIAELASLMQ
jgi:hypothetical protein